jgi:hypothetical protein
VRAGFGLGGGRPDAPDCSEALAGG